MVSPGPQMYARLACQPVIPMTRQAAAAAAVAAVTVPFEAQRPERPKKKKLAQPIHGGSPVHMHLLIYFLLPVTNNNVCSTRATKARVVYGAVWKAENVPAWSNTRLTHSQKKQQKKKRLGQRQRTFNLQTFYCNTLR